MKSTIFRAGIALALLGGASAARAQAQSPAWPKNEYGQIVVEGGQPAATSSEASRKQAQQRIMAWFSKYFADGRAAEGGRLSARGEFNGWGTMPALTIGQHAYRFRMGVGARLLADSLTYRIGEIQCVTEQAGKPRTIPLEELLKSRNPEHQQAALAFRKQLDEFVKEL